MEDRAEFALLKKTTLRYWVEQGLHLYRAYEMDIERGVALMPNTDFDVFADVRALNVGNSKVLPPEILTRVHELFLGLIAGIDCCVCVCVYACKVARS